MNREIADKRRRAGRWIWGLSGGLCIALAALLCVISQASGEREAIVEFAPWEESITVPQGTSVEDIPFPELLHAVVALDGKGTGDDGSREVPVVWRSGEYDGETPGIYLFTADVSGGYLYNGERPLTAVTVEAGFAVEPEQEGEPTVDGELDERPENDPGFMPARLGTDTVIHYVYYGGSEAAPSVTVDAADVEDSLTIDGHTSVAWLAEDTYDQDALAFWSAEEPRELSAIPDELYVVVEPFVITQALTDEVVTNGNLNGIFFGYEIGDTTKSPITFVETANQATTLGYGYVIQGQFTVDLANQRYFVVESGVQGIIITLDDAKLSTTSLKTLLTLSADTITTIRLKGESVFTSTSTSGTQPNAGIGLVGNAELSIENGETDGTEGSLEITPGNTGAGIGTEKDNDLDGSISIRSGAVTVNLSSASHGAGIGTGSGGNLNGDISISGGNITITQAFTSLVVQTNAGIGTGGDGDLNGSIDISGGNIKVSASVRGASIGTGDTGDLNGFISIRSDAIVKAKSSFGASIGTGMTGSINVGALLTITDGCNVELERQGGAGIGTGNSGSLHGDIVINEGAKIIATENGGTSSGAGIGSGVYGFISGSIYIDNAELEILAGSGAGIGGGNQSTFEGNIKILNCTFIIKSCNGGAAIGTGTDSTWGDNGELIIYDSNIYASAQSPDFYSSGAGIGAGSGGYLAGSIVIDGGHIEAYGGLYDMDLGIQDYYTLYGGAGIGAGGGTDISGSRLSISASTTLYAFACAQSKTGKPSLFPAGPVQYAIDIETITGPPQFVNAYFTDDTEGPLNIAIQAESGDLAISLPDKYKAFAYTIGSTTQYDNFLSAEIEGDLEYIVNGDYADVDNPAPAGYGPHTAQFNSRDIRTASGDDFSGLNGSTLLWPVMLEQEPDSAEVTVEYYYIDADGNPQPLTGLDTTETVDIGDTYTIDTSGLPPLAYAAWYYTLSTDDPLVSYYFEESAVDGTFTVTEDVTVRVYGVSTILDVGFSKYPFFWYANADNVHYDAMLDPTGNFYINSPDYYMENHSTLPLEIALMDYTLNTTTGDLSEIEDDLLSSGDEIELNLEGDLAAAATDGTILGQDILEGTGYTGTYAQRMAVGERWTYKFGGLYKPILAQLPTESKTSDYLLVFHFGLYLGPPD